MTKRARFMFWLDSAKAAEAELIKTIKRLKEERLFSETVRDGIRLICDLRNGSLDVLFELYPWVRGEFLEYVRGLGWGSSEQVTALQSTIERLLIENEELKSNMAIDEKSIQQRLARIENLIQSNQHATPQTPQTGLNPMQAVSAPNAPKSLDVQDFAPPSFGDDDDDLLMVKKDEGAGARATQNFLNSMMRLQGWKDVDVKT